METDARLVIADLLRFQYEWLGWGRLRCRSCGSYAYEEVGVIGNKEPCSPNCSWERARRLIAVLADADPPDPRSVDLTDAPSP